MHQVEAAVSAVTRMPAERLRRRGPARSLLFRAARLFTGRLASDVADALGVAVTTVTRAGTRLAVPLRLVQRVLGDPRFARLDDGDLRRLPRWSAYRTRT